MVVTLGTVYSWYLSLSIMEIDGFVVFRLGDFNTPSAVSFE